VLQLIGILGIIKTPDKQICDSYFPVLTLSINIQFLLYNKNVIKQSELAKRTAAFIKLEYLGHPSYSSSGELNIRTSRY